MYILTLTALLHFVNIIQPSSAHGLMKEMQGMKTLPPRAVRQIQNHQSVTNFGTVLSRDAKLRPGQFNVMTAEESKNEIWERLYQGRESKAAEGGYAGFGSPAFGLQSVDGELVENPSEQQIIELIRRHHKSGKSLQQIADWLNQQGYTTKRGHQWHRISIKRVLDRLYGRNPKLNKIGDQDG
jgi:hypothetical protein